MMSWFPQSMLAATLLMLIILCVRREVAERFGAEWAYALWLLPLFRTVLPPLPKSVVPAQPLVILLPSGVTDSPAAVPLSSGGAVDAAGLLFALWIGGAALFLCWQQSAYGAFLLHLGPDGKPADPPSFGGIRVIESTAVDGPVAVGFFKRRIVVPVDFATRYSPAERRLALEHELIHHRRFDLTWNFVALVLLALNWFNPIAHLAFRAFRADQELSCDALVARRAPGERHDYALALVKSASSAGLIAAAPLNHAAFLKRRLKMMNSHRASRLRAAGGAAAFLMASAAALMTASAGSARAPRPAGAAVIVAAPNQPAFVLPPEKAEAIAGACDRVGKGHEVIVCRDDQIARSPEIKAIVDRAVREARAQAAQVRPEQMAEVKTAMERAHAALADPEVRRQLVDADRIAAAAQAQAAQAVASAEKIRAGAIRDALETARVQLASSDWKNAKLAAIRSVEMSLSSTSALGEDQREAVAEALREARDEIQAIDLTEDLRAAQEELDQAAAEAEADR